MELQLTVVVRFTNLEDLDLQLGALKISEIQKNEDSEILCMGYGSADEYSKAKHEWQSSGNIRFYHTDGDYAEARTRGISLAKGNYVLLTNIKYKYNLQKALALAETAGKQQLGCLVISGSSRSRIPGQRQAKGILEVGVENAPENYFQACGLSASNKIIAKDLATSLASREYMSSVRDDAFAVALLCEKVEIGIVDSGDSAARSVKAKDDESKQDIKYEERSTIASTNLLLDELREISNIDSQNLRDSYWRMLASRIRVYLKVSGPYEIRRSILNIVSENENALNFFTKGNPDEEWTGVAKRNYEFVKAALRRYLVQEKMANHQFDAAIEVASSQVKDPEVSVIIPAYNAADYVGETIQSVLDQSYGNIEIVVIDDGSSDGTLKVLEDAARSDNRIAVFTQPNSGLSMVRNLGMKVAKGKYITFLDGDDLLAREAIKEAMDRIKADDLDIVLYDAETFFDQSDIEESHSEYKTYYHRTKEYGGVYKGAELVSLMKDNSDYKPSACLYVFDANLPRSIGLDFVPGVLHEDNYFTFELLNKAGRVSHIQKPLYRRRMHADSIMSSKKSFENSYGYFVCALKMMSKSANIDIMECDPFEDLSVLIAYPLVKNAQRDLIKAPEGQIGGLYALSDAENRLYRMMVSEPARVQKLEDEVEALKSGNTPA